MSVKNRANRLIGCSGAISAPMREKSVLFVVGEMENMREGEHRHRRCQRGVGGSWWIGSACDSGASHTRRHKYMRGSACHNNAWQVCSAPPPIVRCGDEQHGVGGPCYLSSAERSAISAGALMRPAIVC